MIDWVNEALKTWGEAKRRIIGRQDKQLRNKDGTPSKTMACGPARSFMGRLDEGGHVGKGKDQIVLSAPPEVYTEAALPVAIGISLAMESGSLSEAEYKLLFVHYVVKAKLAKKIKYIGRSHKTYYSRLHNIQCRLSGYIYATQERQSQSVA